jgi:hypothetical protein
MKRAERRHYRERIKARMWRYLATWSSPVADERLVQHMASTHGRPCSCWMCAYRKDVPPRRERAALAEF